MDSASEEITEITATLISLRYSSSITIAHFKADNGEFTLYGERRMMGILNEYINRQLLLFVRSSYNWSWRPADENIINDEL
ncbi:MAG: hypothetical protein HQ591_04650 [candidate division Zixibacteria bacterium]|nr:hypothetical protein [Candidatus Tariuqbacter arcticus]